MADVKIALTEDCWGEFQSSLLGPIPFDLKKGRHTAKSEQDEELYAFLAETRTDIVQRDDRQDDPGKDD